MSVCTFIASDFPLKEVAPAQDYPLEISVVNGQVQVFDGGADDNFFLHAFPGVGRYTNKPYGVSMEWDYTDGRARQIIAYLETALQDAVAVELWHVWLQDVFEYEERPCIHRKTLSIHELTIEDVKEIDQAALWNHPDKMYPDRPSFYCLTVTR